MIFAVVITKQWRAVMLAISVSLGLVSVAQAHALPGSVLKFAKAGQNLTLSITLPLHDLEIADPRFTPLSDAQLPYDLDSDSATLLADYFDDHLQVQQGGSEIAFTIVNASLGVAENEDVGANTIVRIELTAPSEKGADIFPLTLKYDAVMHEVRNHRALILWAVPNKDLMYLAEFGFQLTNGNATPVSLFP